ncbi:CLOCK-interacting pacemaker [Colossoma macropomum]|uniref:CLOCK-interacting pacemaker n=1 Tax=Colossoma macropomum TaxID=42526 RepID=UPI0018652ABE|nr:CLOCK-interacting pacemaker [Colossoma macropomum]XP_036440990.1 CLOCK-interacting pacemaker [Colossoma macropomum]XP_036440991.1 CLOCK-interacting pacemaker [Colossoma macropomum]
MPLDSGCVGERPARPASKNAKDKSNSAALLASRSRAHTQQEVDGRDSRCSSEKDSGYSDTGSDSLQTDAEDQRSVSEPKLHKAPGVQSVSDQGKHILVSTPPELTPIFIIKNVVLKQPVQSGQEHVLQSPLGWGSGGANPQTPTHLLLLQQPGLSTPPLHLLKPQSQRSKSKNTYLPILNSYPRIAPHPSKKTPDKPPASLGGSADEHSLSKRVCTEAKREEVSTSTQAPEKHPRKQPESRPQPRPLRTPDTLLVPHHRRSPRPPCSPSPLSLSSPSVSSSETPSPPSACESAAPSSRGLQKHASGTDSDSASAGGALPASAKHRRFLNTVEILSQSGLLDITLRTQELLRQSAATERDIAQLRQHAQLLCHAAQAGARTPAAWMQLHQAMAESGCYPSLKGLVLETAEDGQLEADISGVEPYAPAACGYGINGGEEMAPPSPLLAPTHSPSEAQGSHSASATTPGHSRGPRSGSTSLPEEILMPPDSSTPGGLL